MLYTVTVPQQILAHGLSCNCNLHHSQHHKKTQKGNFYHNHCCKSMYLYLFLFVAAFALQCGVVAKTAQETTLTTAPPLSQRPAAALNDRPAHSPGCCQYLCRQSSGASSLLHYSRRASSARAWPTARPTKCFSRPPQGCAVWLHHHPVSTMCLQQRRATSFPPAGWTLSGE